MTWDNLIPKCLNSNFDKIPRRLNVQLHGKFVAHWYAKRFLSENCFDLLHNNISLSDSMSTKRGCRGRDRVEIEFTTTCAISSYDHLSCEFEPRLWRGALHITVCDKIC